MNDQPDAGEATEITEIPTANLAALMRLAADTEYAELIADETSRRRKLYELLADSDDPLWREIGTQLRDGQMQLRDVLGVDAYTTHLIDAIDKHGSGFPTALAETRECLETEVDKPAHR